MERRGRQRRVDFCLLARPRRPWSRTLRASPKCARASLASASARLNAATAAGAVVSRQRELARAAAPRRPGSRRSAARAGSRRRRPCAPCRGRRPRPPAPRARRRRTAGAGPWAGSARSCLGPRDPRRVRAEPHRRRVVDERRIGGQAPGPAGPRLRRVDAVERRLRGVVRVGRDGLVGVGNRRGGRLAVVARVEPVADRDVAEGPVRRELERRASDDGEHRHGGADRLAERRLARRGRPGLRGARPSRRGRCGRQAERRLASRVAAEAIVRVEPDGSPRSGAARSRRCPPRRSFIPPALFGASERRIGGDSDCAGGGRTERRSSSSRSLKSADSTGGALDAAMGVRDELGGDSCGRSISPKSPNAAESTPGCRTWAAGCGGGVAGPLAREKESPNVGSSISPKPRAGAGKLSSAIGRRRGRRGQVALGAHGQRGLGRGKVRPRVDARRKRRGRHGQRGGRHGKVRSAVGGLREARRDDGEPGVGRPVRRDHGRDRSDRPRRGPRRPRRGPRAVRRGRQPRRGRARRRPA